MNTKESDLGGWGQVGGGSLSENRLEVIISDRNNWIILLVFVIQHCNHNSEGRGRLERIEIRLQGKLAAVLWGHIKAYNLEEMVDDNQERDSVAETSHPLEDNNTTLSPSVRIAREISSKFWPQKKGRGT